MTPSRTHTATFPITPLNTLSPRLNRSSSSTATSPAFPRWSGITLVFTRTIKNASKPWPMPSTRPSATSTSKFYITSWDETTDPFFQALARARQRGVEVKFLFDQIGSFKYKGYRTLGKRLSAIDVDWRLMLPLQIHKFRFRRPDLRNHRKMVIIDGKRGFIGSLNLIKREYKTTD